MYRNQKKSFVKIRAGTWINLLFALLKPSGLAGHFEYNKPQFEDNFILALRGNQDFFLREKGVAKGARIFMKF